MSRYLLLLCVAVCGLAAAESAGAGTGAVRPAGWSGTLLRELLDSGSASKAGARQSGEGFVLRSYQLRHLRLGDGGRARSAVQLIQRLLPEGSSLRQDLPANSLHLLSSPSAHAAVWEFVSAVDVPTEAPVVRPAELSPELREALGRLEALQAGSGRVAGELERLQAGFGRLEDSGERGRSRLALAAGGGLAVLAALGVFGFWRLNRGLRARPLPASQPGSQPVQALIQGALLPAQQEMQREMMGVLNAAAIRLEAWYGEQKARGEALELAASRQQESLALAQSALLETREQLRLDNAALVEGLGARMDASTARLDDNVRALGDQQRRVEALAGELQLTVRELDETRDRMLGLQHELESKSGQLDLVRENLGRRESELAHQQAKLAALTLILEEGAGGGGLVAMTGEVGGVNQSFEEAGGLERAAEDKKETLCTAMTGTSYQFLPPDHPED